ncbi:MAG: hypothetical protein U0791_20335 [Gemmataceae bacterium]
MAVLAERERWPRGDIESLQLERLNAVWRHAIAHVPYYRELRGTKRLPARFASLEEYRDALPVLPKAAVRTQPELFLSNRPHPGIWKRTSGSTGIPTRVYWGREAYGEVLRCKYRFQQSWGVGVFDKQAFLWGNGVKSFHGGMLGVATRFRQPVEDWLRNRVRLPAYRLGREDLRSHLRRLAAARPAALYAYSSAAYLLASEAIRSRVRLDSLRVVMVSAEPAFPHVVSTVERAFGVPAVNEYGSSDCGMLAAEQPDRTLRVREDSVILETLPRVDGRHDIIVTVLSNPSFPLLRYAVGDVSDGPIEVPEAGFSRLTNVAGRDNDFLLTRGGQPLHSVRFDYLFENARGVRRYRAHQHRDGSLSVQIEACEREAPPDVAAIRRETTELLEGYPVDVAIVDAIPPAANGKHRWVLSELAPAWGAEHAEPTTT